MGKMAPWTWAQPWVAWQIEVVGKPQYTHLVESPSQPRPDIGIEVIGLGEMVVLVH